MNMSKKTKLTKNEIDALIERMKKQLSETTLYDGKLSLSFDTGDAGEHKAVLTYSPAAFSKMLMLMMSADSLEVGWNASVEKQDTGKYYVKDIFVAPQSVSGGAVNTNKAEFGLWMTKLNKNTDNKIRMQGHYHVGFSATPSQTDTQNWQEILTDVRDDMFYVFTIWNKRMEHYTVIFDNIDGVKYENQDIDIAAEGFDISEFMKEKSENIKTSYAKASSNVYSGTSYADSVKPYVYKNDSYGAAPLYRDGVRVDRAGQKTRYAKTEHGGKKKVLASQLDMSDVDPCGYDDWRK